MRLPTSVLARVRGSVAVVAMLGCSGASEPTPAPVPPTTVIAVAAVAPDPVPYDDARETARLARLDEREADAAGVRAARIDDATAAAQARRDRAIFEALGGMVTGPGEVGSIGGTDIGPGQEWRRTACLACGRG